VRPKKQFELADAVRDHLAQLSGAVSEISNRGEPISRLEGQLMVDAANARLERVEAALREDAQLRLSRDIRRRVRGRVRRAPLRFRSWASPRIGTLHHHSPRPLRLPVRYLRVDPPTPPPTISIVTPSFQQGRFLERTLYSVVNQSYPALEYIVQDGGSTDGTIEVLQRFEELLKDWKSEPDGGQADAINRGFANTSGEIMAWLNSDDLLLPGSLAYVARYFVAHPDVDVVYGHRVLIDVNDDRIGSWILPRHDDWALALADYVPQETLFWRRRVWDAIGARLDTSFRYSLDWELLLRMREAGATMVRLPRFLGAFRVHETQKTLVDSDIGLAECTRLREQVHGRAMSVDEVLARLVPYMVRHIAADKLHRIANVTRVPRRRVRTVPLEPWLRHPDAGGTDRFGIAPLHGSVAVVSPLLPQPEGVVRAVTSDANEDGTLWDGGEGVSSMSPATKQP
jgi:GT2 family glycosyltransferase